MVKKALIVGISPGRHINTALVRELFPMGFEWHRNEMRALVSAAGFEVGGEVWQKLPYIDPAYFMGKGKVREVLTMGFPVVVVAHDLKPAQFSRWEDIVDDFGLNVEIYDRTSLILRIFEKHAYSREAKLRVELARNLWLLPRLRGWGLELSRLGGQPGTRGPGEMKIEMERRRLRERIRKLRAEINKYSRERENQRKRRKRASLLRVSIVGYTNAGKSTLLRFLSKDSSIEVENAPFATLSPRVRRIYWKGKVFLASDTVGFISGLPPLLLDAFRSTLEEIGSSDVIWHVIDSSVVNSPSGAEYLHSMISTVENILGSLGFSSIPVVKVFNKVDTLNSPSGIMPFVDSESVLISASKGMGIDELVEKTFKIGSASVFGRT